MRIILSLLFVLILSLTIITVETASAEQRAELVIGNNHYSNGPLKNPVGDAADNGYGAMIDH